MPSVDPENEAVLKADPLSKETRLYTAANSQSLQAIHPS